MNLSRFPFMRHFHNKLFLAGALLVLLIISVMFLLPSRKDTFATAHEELVLLSANIRGHYSVRPDYWGLNNESAIKNKLIPPKILRGQKIVGSLGREILIGQDCEGNMVMPGTRYFMLTIENLSKKACIEMASSPFSTEEHFGLSKISIFNQEQTAEFEWGGKNSLPISVTEAEKYCQNRNSVSWVFE